jgi:hypothetical protein
MQIVSGIQHSYFDPMSSTNLIESNLAHVSFDQS